MSLELLLPVGRMIWGSFDKPQTKDYDGNPLIVKTGPNVGQPAERWTFGLAIEKQGEDHWGKSSWGAPIWNEAYKEWTNNEPQRADFAWKIQDGDSQQVNKRNKRWCDLPHYPGNWVLSMAQAFKINKYTQGPNGAMLDVTDTDGVIVPGYFIEVYLQVSGNKNPNNPGIYLNPSMVYLAAPGERIIVGPDPTKAGFGQGALPAGAVTAPAGGMSAPEPGVTPPPAQNNAAQAPIAPHTVQTPGQAAAPPAPGQAAAPPAPGQAAAPPAPPVSTGPKQTAKWPAGFTYDQMIATGWTEETLRSHGYIE